MGLAAIGDFKLAGFIPVVKIFTASHTIGRARARRRAADMPTPPPALKPSPEKLVTLQTASRDESVVVETADKH